MSKENLALFEQHNLSFDFLSENKRKFNRILFLTCPTGAFCREDRCQSFFDADLVPTMRPPLEECEAGGAITSSGSIFEIIDSPALNLSEKQVLDRINKFNPDLIIISITFGSLDKDLQWSKKLKKEYPNIPLGTRGAPCYVYPRELLQNKNSGIDFCMHGDYEIILRSIIESGIENAVGITYYSKDSGIHSSGSIFADNLDQLPLADRSGIDSKIYTVRGLKKPQATIRVQRGCPFPCTYCLVHTVSGKKARHRSPENIIKEMKSLLSEGIKYFYLRADTFTLDRKWALNLLKQIAIECPTAKWVTTTRVELLDDEILQAMKNAGCYGISFGLDVANKKIAEKVNKPLRKSEAISAISLCNKHSIISLAYIMIGFIWDTEDTLNETADFISAICPDLLTIHFAHPYPGTIYHQQVLQEQKSIKIVSLKAQAEPALEPGGLKIEDLKKFSRKLLKKHYRRPKVVGSLAIKLARLLVENFKAAKSFNHIKQCSFDP